MSAADKDGAAETARIRQIIIAAVEAGRFGFLPETPIVKAIEEGDRDLSLDELNFDSLAWMEFCISIELKTGQELTPADLQEMRFFWEIEDWLRGKL